MSPVPVDKLPTAAPSAAGRWPAWLEALLVALAGALFFRLLLSDLMVDDAPAYVEALHANRFVWDVAHLWVQPLALIAFRLLSPALNAVQLLEAMNVTACALAMGIFFRTLRLAGLSLPRALAGVALLAVSFNIVSLGPTAHIKLLVFPALAAALHYAVRWELALQTGRASLRDIAISGMWLGVGATLLVSVLPMGPFIALMALWAVRRQGGSWRAGWQAGVVFGIAMGISGLVFLLAGYLTALATDTTHAGLVAFVRGSVADKDAMHAGFFGFVEVPARIVYSLIYNFVFLPDIGSLGRAAMHGMVHDLTPYAPRLLRDALVAGGTLLALGTILWFSVRAVMQRRGHLMPFGFLLGAAAFAAYWNLNDPEHWFQFTLPIVVLIALNCPHRVAGVLLFVWMPALAVVNLGLYGVHRARFDVAAGVQDVREKIGAQGLYVGYAGYPGEPDSSVLPVPGLQRFRLDTLFYTSRDAQTIQAQMTLAIDTTLARGGRVFVFRVLDEGDWRGPILALSMSGLSRMELSRTLRERYVIADETVVGGFPAHEIIGIKREVALAPRNP
ncbi:MAG: hypothetical protein QM776_16305 [Rhodocyclaceae bacterium]